MVVPVVSVKRANLMETLSIMLRVVGGDCGEHGSRVKNSGRLYCNVLGRKTLPFAGNSGSRAVADIEQPDTQRSEEKRKKIIFKKSSGMHSS